MSAVLERASLRDTTNWVLLSSQRSFNKYISYDQKKNFSRMKIYVRKIYILFETFYFLYNNIFLK